MKTKVSPEFNSGSDGGNLLFLLVTIETQSRLRLRLILNMSSGFEHFD